MHYGIHHVSIKEEDDYMNLDMLENLRITYKLQYILIDNEAGVARIMDIEGHRLKILEDHSKDSEWQLLVKIIKMMTSGDTIIAGIPDDVTISKDLQKPFYKLCLTRNINLLFLKSPQLDSSNFTQLITGENREIIESVIWKLLEVPIVYDERSQEKVLEGYRHKEDVSYKVKKTSQQDY